MKPIFLAILIVMNFFWAASLSIYKALESHLAPGGIVTMRFGTAAVILAALWPWLPGKAPHGYLRTSSYKRKLARERTKQRFC